MTDIPIVRTRPDTVLRALDLVHRQGWEWASVSMIRVNCPELTPGQIAGALANQLTLFGRGTQLPRVQKHFMEKTDRGRFGFTARAAYMYRVTPGTIIPD